MSQSPRLRLRELECGGSDHLHGADQLGVSVKSALSAWAASIALPKTASAACNVRSSVDTSANRSSASHALSLNADGERLARDNGDCATARAGCGEVPSSVGIPNRGCTAWCSGR